MEIYNGMYCVYAHINKISGKIYIGQTIHGNHPNYRWRDGDGYKKSPHFWNAIQKYGWDNFEHEVIASNLTKDEADNFEMLLISKLHTCDNNFGYNLTLGGDGLSGYNPTEETRKKMSESKKGRKLSDETKKKMSDASKGRNVGRSHTSEELAKMRGKKRKKKTTSKIRNNTDRPLSEATKRKIQESSHKKMVLQKDIDGNVLKQYDSISSASRETGVNLGNISSCCNKHIPMAGGFVWDFI